MQGREPGGSGLQQPAARPHSTARTRRYLVARSAELSFSMPRHHIPATTPRRRWRAVMLTLATSAVVGCVETAPFLPAEDVPPTGGQVYLRGPGEGEPPIWVWPAPEAVPDSLPLSTPAGVVLEVSPGGAAAVTPVVGRPAWLAVYADSTRRDTLGFVLRRQAERLTPERRAQGWARFRVYGVELHEPPSPVVVRAFPTPTASVVTQINIGVIFAPARTHGWAYVADHNLRLVGYSRLAPLETAERREERRDARARAGRAGDCRLLAEYEQMADINLRAGIEADRAEEARNGRVVPGIERQFTEGEKRRIRQAIDNQVQLAQLRAECGR